jgi:hypothetical protein
MSTIDLFGGRFVLLAGTKGHGWREAVGHVATAARPELVAHTISGDDEFSDPDGAWRNLYELDEDGAVLVRPDGYVCWRSHGGVTAVEEVLSTAFDRVLGRG